MGAEKLSASSYEALDAFVEIIASRVAEKLAPGDRSEWFDWKRLPQGVSRRVVLEAGVRGELPTYKVGRIVVVKTTDVEAWLERRQVMSRRGTSATRQQSGWAARELTRKGYDRSGGDQSEPTRNVQSTATPRGRAR